jgi:hypothetical protein
MNGTRRGRKLGTGKGRGKSLAKVLGWLSIGLGTAQLIGARQMAGSLGLSGRESLIRLCGAREIGSGVLLLTGSPRVGATTRVIGDMLDLVTLLPATRNTNPRRSNAILTTAMVAAITAVDLMTVSRASRHRG